MTTEQNSSGFSVDEKRGKGQSEVMISTIALFLKLLAVAPAPRPYVPADVIASLCETVGPRLDGSMVTICDGKVVSVSYPTHK